MTDLVAREGRINGILYLRRAVTKLNFQRGQGRVCQGGGARDNILMKL